MDFFTHQDLARKRTTTLVLLFLLAVVGIILAIYLLLILVLSIGWQMTTTTAWCPPDFLTGSQGDVNCTRPFFSHSGLFLPCALVTSLIIAIGALVKIASLRHGGSVIARELGGVEILPSTSDPYEKRLLNVTQEMAIASGILPPTIFVLPNEDSINAFAAGFSPNAAVIAVSRGALRLLSRDELQGVIAHEFSHILNGDMRLNIRLVGLLNGILAIAILGSILMRLNERRSRWNSKDNPLIAFVFGLGLYLIGYIGVFFSHLIKSAVSRQREFLADASAVQFTRNASGLAGALKKIGGLAEASRIQHPVAEEASHLFFAQGLRQSIFPFLSTHPPLVKRIQRLEPSFNGEFREITSTTEYQLEDETRTAQLKPVGATIMQIDTPAHTQVSTQEIINSIGTCTPSHVSLAGEFLAAIPTELSEITRETKGVIAALVALLIDRNNLNLRERQLEIVTDLYGSIFLELVTHLEALVRRLPRHMLLPLIELLVSSLTHSSPKEAERLDDVLTAIATIDSTVTLFEYGVIRLLRKATSQGGNSRTSTRFTSLTEIREPLHILLSALAHAESKASRNREQAFRSGADIGEINASLVPPERCSLDDVHRALIKLEQTAPTIKKRVAEAAATVVCYDGVITIKEGDLLRIILISLDCPIPPFLPSYLT